MEFTDIELDFTDHLRVVQDIYVYELISRLLEKLLHRGLFCYVEVEYLSLVDWNLRDVPCKSILGHAQLDPLLHPKQFVFKLIFSMFVSLLSQRDFIKFYKTYQNSVPHQNEFILLLRTRQKSTFLK